MATLENFIIEKPTEAQGYLVAAREMIKGASPLEQINPMPAFALTLLCGHSCEAALKAMLAQTGVSADDLSKKPYGHNIVNLWASAQIAGFQLPDPQPDWVAQLAQVYDKPFHLRYPLSFHGIVLPNLIAMLRGTESLVALAATFVK